ncbi:leucine-rich repeat domain-containing protein [Aureivirga sp. CE67]|uniref:leucine-rich repeat domain-containing protein n=1 Tax=Aureivirga sp. CE67 TaxID=1788983 RepID=UPI0018CBC66C|nr:leucine-rich repeat domain-containing protein [Aureivirga sp. CE67]
MSLPKITHITSKRRLWIISNNNNLNSFFYIPDLFSKNKDFEFKVLESNHENNIRLKEKWRIDFSLSTTDFDVYFESFDRLSEEYINNHDLIFIIDGNNYLLENESFLLDKKINLNNTIVFSHNNEKDTNISFKINSFYKNKLREVISINLFDEHSVLFKKRLFKIIFNHFSDYLSKIRQFIQVCIDNKGTYLPLSSCNLTSLYEIPEIFETKHFLEELQLCNESAKYENNKWTHNKIGNFQEINMLGGNIPEEIKNLSKLKKLHLGGDWKNKDWNKFNFQNIEVLNGLENLEYLNISNNELEKIPSFEGLQKLKTLYLNNNNIKNLDFNSTMEKLEELNLSSNQIENLDFVKFIPNVKTLDLHSNKIKDVKPLIDLIYKIGIKNSRWNINTINIADNLLDNFTSSLIDKSSKHILQQLNEISNLKEEEINNIREIKVILIGNSEVGKSTLANYLKNKKYKKDIETTLWLEEFQIKLKIPKKNIEYQINLFDIGGHDFYHDTHHLIYSPNSIFILLWDKKTHKYNDSRPLKQKYKGKIKESFTVDFPLEYWLDSILYYFKKKEFQTNIALYDYDKITNEEKGVNKITDVKSKIKSNTLVVQNKVSSIKNILHLNHSELFDKFPFIFDFTNFSIKNYRNTNHFKDLLFQNINHLEISSTPIQNYYNTLKNRILKSNKIIVDKNEFILLCKENKSDITNEQIENFIVYLLDLSVIIHFFDNNRTLNLYKGLKNISTRIQLDKIILNKKSLKLNISFNDRFVIKRSTILSILQKTIEYFPEYNGVIKENNLKEILNSNIGIYSNKINYTDLIVFLIDKKILFKQPNTKNFIAPLYLPKEPDDSINMFLDEEKFPNVKYKYEGYIHKSFIFDIFNKFKNEISHYFWKNGILLKRNIEIILIKFIISENGCFVDIYKQNNNKSNDFFNSIIDYIEDESVFYDYTKLVPNIHNEFAPLEEILKYQKQNILNFKYDNKNLKLSDFKKHLSQKNKMKKIFISYSKQDLKYIHEFKKHLSALHLNGKVSDWYCSELEAGSEWSAEIKKHFDESDIICFMVSPNFMNTPYIQEYEIKPAFERYKKDKSFRIVPIFLDYCQWRTEEFNLSKFTGLPYTAKPIADFNNKNIAWYIISECLRIVIEQDNISMENENHIYTNNKLPKDILSIYERLIEGKLDNNSI